MRVQISMRRPYRWGIPTAVTVAVVIGTVLPVWAAPGAADPKASAAVSAAVTALKKEYAANANPHRATSNYFIENKSADVTSAAILAALESSVASSPRETAYIKWQLLSALPSNIDATQVSQLCRIYSAAPAFVPHPGLDPQIQNEIFRDVAEAPLGELAKINSTWDTRVQNAMAPDDLIGKYRDDLFSHLPHTFEAIKAGLQDGHDRAEAGVNAKPFMAQAVSACQAWVAAGTAQPAELTTIKQAVGQMVAAMPGQVKVTALAPGNEVTLLDTYTTSSSVILTAAAKPVAKKPVQNQNQNQNQTKNTPEIPPKTGGFPPKFYEKADWDAQKKHVQWMVGAATFEDKTTLVKLEKMLDDAIKKPGGLQVKKAT